MTETFTIAQLSDPHLSSLDNVRVRDLFSKRVLGYLSWRLNRRARYRPEVLAELVRDLQSQRPDHTVVTGDLTHIGLPQECQEAKDWLDALGGPSEVTVVPGNHDMYVATNREQTLGLWNAYMHSDPLGEPEDRESQECFPGVRVRGPVAFISVSTARPSAPFFAIGTIGNFQLDALEQALVQTGERGLFRVVLLHHPPVRGTVPWQKRLTDQDSFCSVVGRCGADLILHGHAHRTFIGEIVAESGIIPVVGVPAASSTSSDPERGAQYHLFRLTQQASAWNVELSVRGYSSAVRRCVEVGASVRL